MVIRRPPFLKATWRNLALVSFEVDPGVLRRYHPPGVELDCWEGKFLVSVVGLQFLNARVLGVPVPFHRSYPQVNFRFYVRRWVDGRWRPGVVFVKQIVPRKLVALVARRVYQEKFVSAPVRHSVEAGPGPDHALRVSYQWFSPPVWNRMSLSVSGEPELSETGSLEEFVAERYYGYNLQRDGSTVEYRIEHPRWRIWRAVEPVLAGDAEGVYGPEFAGYLAQAPASALLAEGSEVVVHRAAVLAAPRQL